jgi:hypothetical protein
MVVIQVEEVVVRQVWRASFNLNLQPDTRRMCGTVWDSRTVLCRGYAAAAASTLAGITGHAVTSHTLTYFLNERIKAVFPKSYLYPIPAIPA